MPAAGSAAPALSADSSSPSRPRLYQCPRLSAKGDGVRSSAGAVRDAGGAFGKEQAEEGITSGEALGTPKVQP